MEFARKPYHAKAKLKLLIGVISIRVKSDLCCVQYILTLNTEFMSVEGNKIFQLVSRDVASYFVNE